MPDDLSRRRPEDSQKINVQQPWEIVTWTRHFGISEEVLRRAVNAVGPIVKDVRQWLRRNGHIV